MFGEIRAARFVSDAAPSAVRKKTPSNRLRLSKHPTCTLVSTRPPVKTGSTKKQGSPSEKWGKADTRSVRSQVEPDRRIPIEKGGNHS